MRVSVLVLSRHRVPLLARCLASVAAQDHDSFETVVLANGCAETAEFVRASHPDVRLIELPENVGSAPGRNRVAAAARGDTLVFLDDDGEIRAPDTLRRLESVLLALPGVGVLSMGLLDAGDDAPTGWARTLGPLPFACLHDVFAGGACAMRAEAFGASGGYMESFSGPSEEFGLAVRIHGAGWAVAHEPAIVFHHHVSKTDATWRRLVFLGYVNLQTIVWTHYPAPWHLFASAKALATHVWVELRLPGGCDVLGALSQGLRAAWRARRDRDPIPVGGLEALYAAKYYKAELPARLAPVRPGILRRIVGLRLRRKRLGVRKLPLPGTEDV